MWRGLDKNKLSMIVINIGCVLALIIVVFPLLLVAKYDYPSADDWSYGVNAYKTIKEGGNFIQVIFAAARSAKVAYLGWDGRFANGFLDSLQPGIWGEQFYSLTPWLLIGMLIVSEMIFVRSITSFDAGDKGKNLLWIPIAIPMLIIQILFCPSPVESFYWYTGGMNYTFVYGLSLILIVLFMNMGLISINKKWQKVLMGGTACILSVFVGGGNFSTSLFTVLVFCIITLFFLMKKKYFFLRRTWFVTLITTVCLAICLLSPGSARGNAARMTGMGSPLLAVWKSVTDSAKLIFSWTFTGEILLMLCLVVPFIYKAVKKLDISFKFPLLFSVLTFGCYASQMMPNIFASGNFGGGRNFSLYYNSFVVWLVGNIFYWIGWLERKWTASERNIAKRRCDGVCLLIYFGVVGIMLVSFIYIFDKKNISVYKAYRDWKQGWAQQYAEEWEARLEILHDESVEEAVFMPLSVAPEMLMYTDLQDEDGFIWVNSACAVYYGKLSVVILDEK